MGSHNEIKLRGCNPIPLAGYLKGMAVLRLVSEQVDSSARGWWEENNFHLSTVMTETEVTEFFLNAYSPTPIIAPWNGGSGFHAKDATVAVDALRSSTSARFADYRESIQAADQVLKHMNLSAKPGKEAKAKLLSLCRSRLPDSALEWLDAAVVLTSDSPRFPPLLGTGGNDGRFEFTNNFMQRLSNVFDVSSGQPVVDGAKWLNAALFGQDVSGLKDSAIGQFFPGGAGGPNSRAGYEGESLVNPWDFILMLEGALVFAAASTKRLETSRTSVLSYPFTVYSAGVGSGAIAETDESQARAEMWMPLWNRRCSLGEMTHLFQEGRVQVNGRPAKDGVDFARACATLAIDRGIDSFQRYAFLQRSGRSYFAVPLNRIAVHRREEADLLTELDSSRWLENLREFAGSSNVHSVQAAYRTVREAIFQVCVHGGHQRVQSLLIAIGQAEQLLGRSKAGREAVRRPLVLKSPKWLSAADDGSVEFELAVAIAGWKAAKLPAVRAYFSPVKKDSPVEWDDNVSPRVVWEDGDLTRNLVRLLKRRLLDAEQSVRMKVGPNTGTAESPQTPSGSTGDAVPDKPFDSVSTVRLAAAVSFLRGQDVLDERVSELLWGLLPLSASNAIREWERTGKTSQGRRPLSVVPWVYGVTRLLSTSDAALRRALGLPRTFRAPLPQELITALASDNQRSVEKVARLATRRLRVSGLAFPPIAVSSPGVSGRRCAAALAFPLADGDLKRLRDLLHIEIDPLPVAVSGAESKTVVQEQ